MMSFGSMYIALALIFSLQLQIVSSFVINNAGIRHSNSFAVNKINNYRTELLAVAIPVEAVAAPITAASTKFCFKKYFSNLFKGVATNKIVALGALIVSALFVLINEVLWKPSRTYDRDENSVGREYDAWTTEGILEEYWGEHIHLGYYSPEEMKAGYKKKNFIQAKYDFVDEMIDFGKAKSLAQPMAVLDVGCGIGGTSRYIAKKFGDQTTVTGITLSKNQVARATALAKERDIPNAKFQVMDALNMTFADNSFDLVWACESGEHMPDKKLYVEEMTRVLKPGGRVVIATWCQREDSVKPFDAAERKTLDFLYAEWTHPYFISIEAYAKLMLGTGKLAEVVTDDWNIQTIASWRHSIWVGVFNPWPVIRRPHLWWKCVRDGITLERMHGAFDEGLMQYGMMTATKASPVAIEPPTPEPIVIEPVVPAAPISVA